MRHVKVPALVGTLTVAVAALLAAPATAQPATTDSVAAYGGLSPAQQSRLRDSPTERHIPSVDDTPPARGAGR